jgi:hypothetical protein
MSDVEIGQSMLAADRIICAPRKVNLQARRERVMTVLVRPGPLRTPIIQSRFRAVIDVTDEWILVRG